MAVSYLAMDCIVGSSLCRSNLSKYIFRTYVQVIAVVKIIRSSLVEMNTIAASAIR